MDFSKLTEQQYKNVIEGKPNDFDVDKFVDVVENFVKCEEIETALWMLDHAPAWYRENGDARIDKLRLDIVKSVAMPADYSKQSNETYEDSTAHELSCGFPCIEEKITGIAPRGPMALELVKKLNAEGKVPQIVEFGPSDFWMAYGLKAQGCNFKYKPLTLNKTAEVDAHIRLFDYWMEEMDYTQPYIYIACEVVEHLTNVDDVKIYSEKCGRSPDYVLFSAPRNCFLGGRPEWRKYKQEHLRTFTPKELTELAVKFWPRLAWQIAISQTIVLLGERRC